MKKEDEIIGGEKSYIPTKEKTITIPVSQLVKANKLVDEIHKELLNLGVVPIDWVNGIIKKLKDCITVTY